MSKKYVYTINGEEVLSAESATHLAQQSRTLPMNQRAALEALLEAISYGYLLSGFKDRGKVHKVEVH